ncbi:hypothetical protein CI102_663 [Trichoderma harzianum]|nr:hypothetical protein CI102_663 [Trichoderma harzianum]
MFSPIRRIAEAFTPKTITIGTTLIFAGVGGAYALRLRDSLRQTNPRHIQSSVAVSESLVDSNTVRKLVNPRSHGSKGDSHSIILSLCSRKNVASEKDLLSAFVTGFFSGPVFLPESIALTLFPLSKLPPISSILWGTFQIAEIELSDSQASESIGSRAVIVFGDNKGSFAGCHRFSVKRLDPSTDNKADEIKFRLSLECLVCDPTSSEPKESEFLHKVHNNYSYFLFRDAVAHTKARFNSLIESSH